jgi:hypothetical protein
MPEPPKQMQARDSYVTPPEKYRRLCQAFRRSTYRMQAALQGFTRSSKHRFPAQQDPRFGTSGPNICQAGPTTSGKRIS